MERHRIQEHFKAIHLESGIIDPMDMTDVVKALIGRPLEAVIPAAARAALLLSADGHASEETAKAIPDGFPSGTPSRNKVWSPPCSNPYRQCLAITSPKGSYAVMLHLGNEPASWHDDIDNMFDKMREAKGLPVEKRDPTPGAAEKIVVCSILPHVGGTVFDRVSLIDIMQADKDRSELPDMCFSRSKSTGGHWKNHGWTDGYNELKDRGIDAWPNFFSKLGATIISAGAADVLRESVREVGARNWWRPSRDGQKTLAAYEAFGDALHAEHGMFLGANAKKAVQTLQGMAMEVDAEHLQKRLSALRPTLEEGRHRTMDSAYVCDELNIWLDEDGAFMLNDQSHTTKVTVDDTSLIVEDIRNGLSPICFTMEGGRASISTPPDLEVIAARTWNSVTLNTESVLYRIEEDKKSQPHP